MKYNIRRKIFALKPSFTIKDESGKDAFIVRSNFRPFGKKFIIMDANFEEVCHIYRSFDLFSTVYAIVLLDEPDDVLTVTRVINLIKGKYVFEGTKNQYGIDRDIFSEFFYILKDFRKTAKVIQKIPAISAYYKVIVPKGNIAVRILAIMIIICLTRNKYLI